MILKSSIIVRKKMCGVFGFLKFKNDTNRTALHNIGLSMSKTLTHRGPDDDGVWQDPDIPLLLGHTRLSIIDLSSNGAQPMTSDSGRYVIAYNGEIYNFISIMRDLEQLGASFKGHSDTEVLLSAIDYWGLNQTLQKVNGMFAFVLWDRKLKTLHFVRDRLGKKPLYVGWVDDSLVFSSELKTFASYPNFTHEIDKDSLVSYFRFGYLTAPLSIFKNVIQIPPASRMSVEYGNVNTASCLLDKIQCYWSLKDVVEDNYARQETLSESHVIELFDQHLHHAVKMRMISDVPLGAFLSGGIDSSLVAALMQSVSSSPIKTFTVGFDEKKFNEAAFAKSIAAHLGTEHYELVVSSSEALNIIPDLADVYDEPFADASQIPTILISSHAKTKVTVALSGDGGDELLGGYRRHTMMPDLWRKVKTIPRPARKLMSAGIQVFSEDFLDQIFSSSPHFGQGLHKFSSIMSLDSSEDVYKAIISKFKNPEDVLVAGREPQLKNLNLSSFPEALGVAEKVILADTLGYLPNDVLTKVDRATMSVSLESRAPLLDYKLMEFCWSLPLKYKIRNGQGKWLMRKILASYVPDTLFERPKMGFQVPLAEWLRGPLKEWCEDLLNEKKLSDDGYLNVDNTVHLWEQHKNGYKNFSEQLWVILMFQMWKERWLSKK